MRLVLADNTLAGPLPVGLLAALAKATDLQKLFRPGGQFAALGRQIDILLGSDAAEKRRFDALMITVRNDLERNYTRITGAPLWAPFTYERAQWLLDVLAIETNRATQDFQNRQGNETARYIRVFRAITDEVMSRLKEQQKTLDPTSDKSIERAGLVIGGAGLALRLLNII